MQSKQKNSRAKNQKKPRGAPAKQKGKAKQSKPRNRPQRSRNGMGALAPNSTVSSAPLNLGIKASRMLGLRFGAAAPNDEFPEGGLRITGVLPPGSNCAILTQDTALLGLFGTTGLASTPICPTGALVTGTTFALFNGAGPLAVFAQYFRKFRFRKLAAEFESLIPPGDTTTGGLIVQLAHERDVVTAEQLSGSYTLDTSVQSINCTRFTVWATEVMCPLINESRSTPSDNLYFVTAAADSIAATSDAELRQVFQGAVTATCSSVNATADKNVGKLLLHFSVDLYGFTNVAADVLPSHRRATMPRSSLGPSSGAEVKRQPPSRDDSKELPDVDLTDFVNLTPKSNRLLVQTVDPSIQLPLVRAVQPTPPPSARVSSKK